MAKVILENVYKSYPTPTKKSSSKDSSNKNVNILRGINLTVEDGEFMVLVGPSGCGKSTLLRLLAGLEEITAGNIWVGEQIINHLPPKARDIAMVFQNYALYPHLNVYDNIAFGLRRMGKDSFPSSWWENLLSGITRSFLPDSLYLSSQEKALAIRVREVAELLQIEGLLKRLPKQLSGGQKQRVALGRAIARNPQVFLMDEPLSNLDAKLRAETRAQIVKLQRQLGTTTIYVTHDQTEAMTMGSRIAVMQGGEIQQIASPLQIYHHPANRFVAEFIGSPPMNFISVTVNSPLSLIHPQFSLTLPPIWAKSLQAYQGNSLLLGIRPEHFYIGIPSQENIPVKVNAIEALGNETFITVEVIDTPNLCLQVKIPAEKNIILGELLSLEIELAKIHLFDAQTAIALKKDDRIIHNS